MRDNSYTPSNYLSIKIDWLEMTIKFQSPKFVINYLLATKPKEFKKLPKGRMGYNTQLKWENGNVFILYNSDDKGRPISSDNMGVHVIMTGTGCRMFEAVHPLTDIMLLFMTAGKHKTYNLTRIDIAIDDTKEKLLKYSRIHWYIYNDKCSSRWTKCNQINGVRINGVKPTGSTMYLGSKNSKIFCRVYNKTIEQRLKCQGNSKRLQQIPKHWTRVELVFKKERADIFAKEMIYNFQSNTGQSVKSALNTYIRFLAPSRYQNKSFRPTAPWWQKFLGEVGKLKLTADKTPQSIEGMKAWIESQVGPTLSAIMKAHQGDVTWLNETIVRSIKRMKNKHHTAVKQYLRKESIE